MKKFAMAAVAAAAMIAGGAQAYTVGTFSNGFVVPNVIHDANGTTAVGLISKGAGCVFWTFFDRNSEHKTDGVFTMTNNQFTPFVWSANSGLDMSGQRGYLVFTAGLQTAAGCETAPSATPGIAISGNAFHVMPGSSDVAYVPVIDGPIDLSGVTNLADMGPDSINRVEGAVVLDSATSAAEFNMRYFIDNQVGGNDTNIVVWSTGNQKRAHTVFMYNDRQAVKSVNFELGYTELDFFNVETIQGRPANFVDGFIRWNVTRDSFATGSSVPSTVSVMTYSVITSPAFGAVQTMLGSHRP